MILACRVELLTRCARFLCRRGTVVCKQCAVLRDGFTGYIDAWLLKDLEVPKKQRHTAKRIYDRLCEEKGFTGGYTTVKDYVRSHCEKAREMFIPLAHPAGHGHADFGEAVVVLGGVQQKVHFFAFDLPHSDACYIRAYHAATSEAWMDGHVHAFAFFGAVPLSVVYDNDSCLVAKIEADGRRRTQMFTEMLSHYLFDDRYGRPGKGRGSGWLVTTQHDGAAARVCGHRELQRVAGRAMPQATIGASAWAHRDDWRTPTA